VIIVEFLLPAPQAIRLQSLLQGEDGLAIIRCFDPEKKRQQFWTTLDQRDDLYRWLGSLPQHLSVEVTGEWVWQKNEGSGVPNEQQ